MLIRSTRVKKKFYTKVLHFIWFLQQYVLFHNTGPQEKFINVFFWVFPLIKFDRLDSINPISLQKLLNIYKLSDKEVKMLNHSNLTKRNLLYTFNYTFDKKQSSSKQKTLSEKRILISFDPSGKKFFSFQSLIWLRPAGTRRGSVIFPI